jgi:hypothetical protein
MRHPVGFLVWNPSRNLPTVQHETLERAQAEAERLRAEHPDETFWVMSPVRGSVGAAKGFSDGKREAYAQALAEIRLAEGRCDHMSEELMTLRRQVSRAQQFIHEAADHQATAADCLLWFDGFLAAHAHREGFERPRTPDREKMRRLNEALQRLIPAGDTRALTDDEIPF